MFTLNKQHQWDQAGKPANQIRTVLAFFPQQEQRFVDMMVVPPVRVSRFPMIFQYSVSYTKLLFAPLSGKTTF